MHALLERKRMLTEYHEPRWIIPDDKIWFGWKAFPWGVQPDMEKKWFQSHKPPGFHVFPEKEAAERYLSGLGTRDNGKPFGTIRPVAFKKILLIGKEGKETAYTAEWLWIGEEQKL